MTIRNSARTLDPAAAQPAEAPPPPQHAKHALPDEPLVVIEARGSRLDLRGVWEHRELLYFLMWRDLKVRYKQTLLGATWVIMQPLLATVIFSVFMGKLARVPSDGIPYPIFVYAGLLPWTFFSAAVTNSGNSLVGNAHLITKVYFPRIIVPLAALGARLVDFAIAFVILGGMMFYYEVGATWGLAVLPLLIALLTLLALGVGLWTSALNVKYRDVGVVLPTLIQFWMFASPILYPSNLVPESWRGVYALNPIVGIIEGFRAALFGREFNWAALTVSLAVTASVLACSAFAFRRMEKSFADVV